MSYIVNKEPKMYHIQFTRSRGDYLIKDQADRQYSRWPSQAEAEAEAAKMVERDAVESAEWHEWMKNLRDFDEEMKSHGERQIEWQEFRSIFYDDMMGMYRQAGRLARHGYIQEAERPNEDAESTSKFYNRLIHLDCAIKTARQTFNAAAYVAALDLAEEVMSR